MQSFSTTRYFFFNISKPFIFQFFCGVENFTAESASVDVEKSFFEIYWQALSLACDTLELMSEKE